MREMVYESPEFRFEELELSERIADTCWGYAYAWYDADKDGVIDWNLGEKVDLKELGLGSSGCQGSTAEAALKQYFKDKFNVTLTDDDVKVNTKSEMVIGSNS